MPAELYPPDFRVRPITRPLTSRFREITTRRTVSMPERVSPHVKLVFAEMARQLARYQDIEDVSGVKRRLPKCGDGKIAHRLKTLSGLPPEKWSFLN